MRQSADNLAGDQGEQTHHSKNQDTEVLPFCFDLPTVGDGVPVFNAGRFKSFNNREPRGPATHVCVGDYHMTQHWFLDN